MSRAIAKLDEGLKVWREPPLGEAPTSFWTPATRSPARRLYRTAVLIAVGIEASGQRHVLGCEIATTKLRSTAPLPGSLLSRGLKEGVELVIADDHAALKASRRAVCPSAPWPRWQFHQSQNTSQLLALEGARKTVAKQLRVIFNAPDKAEAERPSKLALDTWRREHPKPALWAGGALWISAFPFPNPDSCLRLVSALLTELDDEWMTGGKVYPNLHP